MKQSTQRTLALVLCALCVVCLVFIAACNDNKPDGNKTLERIEIEKQPTKTEYYVGEKFSRTGMKVKAYYSDGTSKNVMKYEIAPDGALTLEDKEITVTFEGKTAKVAISVTERPIDAQLTVDSAVTYTYKVEAEDLPMGNEQEPTSNEKYLETHNETSGNPSTSGGKSIGNLNGSNEIIRMKIKSEVEANVNIVMSLAWVEPAGANALDFDQNVDTYWNNTQVTTGLKICRDDPAAYVWFDWHEYTVANLKLTKGYNDFVLRIKGNFPNMDYVKVVVNPFDESKVTGVEVTTAPTKTAYYEGETFNAYGKMVVSAVLDDGNKIPLNDYSVDKTVLAASDTTVTVGYLGFTATVDVTVTIADIASLEVAAQPDKTEYYPGQKFDRTGLKLVAKTADGISLDVTRFAEYTPETFDQSGKVAVVATYGGKTANIDVTVADIEPQVNITDGESKSYRVEAEDALFVKGNGDKEKYTVVDDANASGGKRLDSCDWLSGSSFIVVVNSEVDAKVVPVVCCDGGGAVEGLEAITVMTWNGEEIILRRNLDHGWGNLQAVGTGKLDRAERNKVFDLKKGRNVFIIRLTADNSVNYDYFEFSVNPIDEIAVTRMPDKVEYKDGDKFDPTGMELTVYYEVTRAKGVEHGENRPTKVVTEGFTCAPETISVDTDKIVVSYLGKTTEVAITVKSEKTLQSITLDTTNVNKTYYVGQKFDKTGLVVTANYSDGTLATIDKYTVETETIALDTTKIVIAYDGKTAEIDGIVVKTHLTIDADTDKVRIEAEDALFTKGSGDKEKYTVVDDSNASGGKRLDSCDWLDGSTFTVTINAKKACKIKIIVATDGPGSTLQGVGTANWNGEDLTFDVTPSGGWGNFAPYEIATVELAEGANVFVWTLTGNINYDYFEFQVVEAE